MPCGATSTGGWTQVLYVQTNFAYNGAVTTSTTGPWDQSVDYSYCSGTCISNFSKRKAAGELLPFTPWVQYTLKGREMGSYAMRYDPPGTTNTLTTIAPYGSYGNRTDVHPTYWALDMGHASQIMADNQFESSIHAAASKIYTSVGHDTLTFLAELGKTKQMLLNTAKSMSRLTQRSGFRPDKSFRSAPGKWLEVRYGWRPLLYDLNDLSKATANLVSGSYLRRLKESSGYNDSGVLSEDSWNFTSSSTKVGVVERKITYDLSVRGSVVADIKPPTFRFNPFATAWELVPYSFVMDWVIDIGSYIEAMAFLTIAQDYKAAGGYKFTIKNSLDRYPLELNPYFSGFYSSHADCVLEGVVRRPTTVALTPSARVRLNEFKVVDLLMLVKQRLGFRR